MPAAPDVRQDMRSVPHRCPQCGALPLSIDGIWSGFLPGGLPLCDAPQSGHTNAQGRLPPGSDMHPAAGLSLAPDPGALIPPPPICTHRAAGSTDPWNRQKFRRRPRSPIPGRQSVRQAPFGGPLPVAWRLRHPCMHAPVCEAGGRHFRNPDPSAMRHTSTKSSAIAPYTILHGRDIPRSAFPPPL